MTLPSRVRHRQIARCSSEPRLVERKPWDSSRPAWPVSLNSLCWYASKGTKGIDSLSQFSSLSTSVLRQRANETWPRCNSVCFRIRGRVVKFPGTAIKSAAKPPVSTLVHSPVHRRARPRGQSVAAGAHVALRFLFNFIAVHRKLAGVNI